MENNNYTATWLAEWFHDWPRLLISQGFDGSNSTFLPDSYDYLEALTFWAALPVAWLFLSFLLFLIYFCCWCCCCRNPKGKRKIPCHKCMLVCCTLLCLGAIGVGLYGNQVMTDGVKSFAEAAEDANNTLVDVETQVTIIDRTLSDDLTQSLEDLQGIFGTPISNETVQQKLLQVTTDMIQEVERAANSVVKVKEDLDKIDVNLAEIADMTNHYEFYRWLITIIVLGWEVIVCLMVFIGVCKTSRCILFLSAVLGLITLIICWTTLGAKLFLTLAISDFCVTPDIYILDQTADKPLDEDVMKYYLYCYPSSYSPFEESLENGQLNLDMAQANLRKLNKWADPYYPTAMSKIHVIDRDLNQTETALQEVTALVDCEVLNGDYMQALNGLCYQVLNGLTFLLLCTAVCGIMFSMLILVGSCAWRKLVNKKDYYKVEKTDPYFPKPQESSAPYLENYYSSNTTMPAILRSPDPEISSQSSIDRRSAEISSRPNRFTESQIHQHSHPHGQMYLHQQHHGQIHQPNGEQSLPLMGPRGSPPPAYHPVTVEHGQEATVPLRLHYGSSRQTDF
ncbi:protein tweety homolog 2-like [Glandiceps talaboti]